MARKLAVASPSSFQCTCMGAARFELGKKANWCCADRSRTLHLLRNTNMPRRLTNAGTVSLRQIKNSWSPLRITKKLPSRRPFAVQNPAIRSWLSAMPATSLLSCAWRNVTASSPSTPMTPQRDKNCADIFNFLVSSETVCPIASRKKYSRYDIKPMSIL